MYVDCAILSIMFLNYEMAIGSTLSSSNFNFSSNNILCFQNNCFAKFSSCLLVAKNDVCCTYLVAQYKRPLKRFILASVYTNIKATKCMH